ncbi:Cwfj-like protein [Chloropicon primus]|uniref:RRM domain-containing protein n=2 Tax=Chloropicon primus TaxID=1764295 RepID=A0A5B8MUD4_9CHLO|nr:hypothetical protein A3770_12p66510 [Chloropicon primus]UPR03342.1 Cwfj-like protein [Chloropicon primus]|eukprot:QDZ24133.1 hypothetical protein A3770_12p66510 [Chloropicon primus]
MVRVLLAGDVKGRYGELNGRVKKVVAKSGAFDLLLCVGDFFGGKVDKGTEENEALSSEAGTELEKWLKGGGKAAVPTYFVGCSSRSPDEALELLSQYPECGITCLGSHGVTKLKDLTVAYYDDLCRSADQKGLLDRSQSLEGEVDLLLTCKWPGGIVPHNDDPSLSRIRGSPVCRKLACTFRPRYHIAACEGKFFARLPYANPDLGAGSHVTRFISLGSVANPGGDKYLHALGLKPSSSMPREAFLANPANTTPFPYQNDQDRDSHPGMKRGRGSEEDGQAWRWGDQQNGKRGRGPQPSQFDKGSVVVNSNKTAFVRNLPYRATEEDIIKFFAPCGGTVVDIRRGKDARGNLKGYAQVQFDTVEQMQSSCSLNENQLMGRPIYISPAESRNEKAQKDSHPIADCWFCLSNQNADVHLVVSVGNDCYCALDKGPITPYHVLVVPIDHISCTIALQDSGLAEISKYIKALSSCFASQGLELVMFERFLKLKGREGGNHCHYNVVGVPKESTERLKAGVGGVLDKKVGVPFGESGFKAALQELVGDMEYMLLVLPDGTSLVHPIMRGERIPYNFLRDELAGAIGSPERGDWKACKVGSKEEEEENVAKFRALFSRYDVMSDS